MSSEHQDKTHGHDELQVIAQRVPPPSQANDVIVMIAAALGGLGGLGFGVSLLLGAPMWLFGGALAVGLLSLAIAVRRYFTDRFPDIEAIEPRYLPEADDEHDEEAVFDVRPVARRPFLARVLVAAGGLFGLGLLAPVSSLGPTPQRTLATTRWRNGVRLVTTGGNPIRPEQIAAGSVVTVWPEGAVGQERSSAVLLKLTGAPQQPTIEEWVVNGDVVTYSKVCTHAGCPVALYRERDNALFCPCHQSTFDAARGAVPTFGPAVRPLPQLPMGLDGFGFLIALGDFEAPVGPPRG